LSTSTVPGGRRFGVRLHQLIGTQAALALLLVGAALGGGFLALTAIAAAGLLALIWVRVHGRWVFRHLAALLRFAGRRRAARLGTPAAVLAFAAPGTRVTAGPAAVFIDDLGLTTLVELADLSTALPPLRTLLPPPADGRPAAQIQLVLTAVAAARDAGPAALSYRALTDGRSLGRCAGVLAVRMARAEGRTEDELRRALLSLSRRLTRRLREHAARQLDRASAVQVIAGLAHADPGDEIREFWTGVRVGGLYQGTFRCLDGSVPAHLLTRLLHLPASAVTMAVTTGRAPERTGHTPKRTGHGPEPTGRGPGETGHGPEETGSLLVRIAAPDAAALENAAQALRRLLGPVQRWDGAHLTGLSATLPLGGWAGAEPFAAPDVPAVPAGLLLGRNRQGGPAQIPFFRPEPTRVLLVGGLPCARLLAFRALATGARVTVHSARPRDWSALAGDSITVLAADRAPEAAAGSPHHPVLTVFDGAAGTDPTGRWQTTLTVRDAITPGDLTTATEADLLVLQPLGAAEAALLGEALHLGETADLLTRMRPAMVALVSRSTVRWAVLAPTRIEKALFGDPVRSISIDMTEFPATSG
jgi:type VII secretion protein EccE